METNIRRQEWTPAREFLPVILGKQISKDLSDDDISKLELFEKGLANELSKDDTIQQAMTKIVKMALAAEFGPSLVAAQGAQKMVSTIVGGIMHDNELRKQALIIIDRFARNKRRTHA
jgi:hypothetical protein